jgi:hypothetical protein
MESTAQDVFYLACGIPQTTADTPLQLAGQAMANSRRPHATYAGSAACDDWLGAAMSQVAIMYVRK